MDPFSIIWFGSSPCFQLSLLCFGLVTFKYLSLFRNTPLTTSDRDSRALHEISTYMQYYYLITFTIKFYSYRIFKWPTFWATTIVNFYCHRNEVSHSFGKPFSSHLFSLCMHFHQSYNAIDVPALNGEKKAVLKLKRPIFIFPMTITNFEIIKYCCETTMTTMQCTLSPHWATSDVVL